MLPDIYYNEFDPQTAAWLRELIKAGHIAPGIVDERSIEDVRPDDLKGFTQCHFFAGIGVWSYALRRAGWPDDRPVWTASCPCQPFSAAGKGDGFADERHLWPAFYHLVDQLRPAGILGEQVASAAVDDWIDLVHADLEALGYAFGSVPFPSAGVGAPHIRDRNYWVAHANSGAGGQGRTDIRGRLIGGDAQSRAGFSGSRLPDGVEYSGSARSAAGLSTPTRGDERLARITDNPSSKLFSTGFGSSVGRTESGGLGNTAGATSERVTGSLPGAQTQVDSKGRFDGRGVIGFEHASSSVGERPGPTNGYWRAADWLGCRDGKWRPVEPGAFPLAYGASARVVRLRGYGNAINAEAAKAWIETVMECVP